MATLVLALALLATPGQRHAAQKLCDKASVAYAAAKYDQALRDFGAAYELDAATSLLFNLAQCHRKLRHWAEALTYYRSYLRERPDAVNRAAVEALVEEVQTHLPSGIRVVGPSAGATGITTPSALPTPTPTSTQAPTATPSPNPTADATPAPSEAIQESPPKPTHSHWLGGTLLAATVVSAGFALFGAVRVASYLSACQATNGSCARGAQTPSNQQNADNWGTTSIVLGIAAAGGVAGTVLTW